MEGGHPHGHAFLQPGVEERVAHVEADRAGASIRSGLRNLVVMKTAGSAFEGFARDRYTTLRETRDRLLATSVDAVWRYADGYTPSDDCWRAARQALLEAFAAHESASVQHTLHAMGAAVLASSSGIEEVRLALPNRHHIPIDLTPFGLKNRNEIFVATPEPYGLIEAVIRRSP
jgi:urate oxidase